MTQQFRYITVNTFHYALNSLYADAFKMLEDDPNCPFMCIVVDSPGGHCWALQSMLDNLDDCGKPVMTILSGLGASCGAVLSTAGTKGLRIMGSNSTMLIHEASGWAYGKTSDVLNDAKELEKTTDNLVYARFDSQAGKEVGYTKNLVMKNMNSDLNLTADEAISHGFMDIKMSRNKALNNAYEIYNDWLLKQSDNTFGGK